MDKKLKRYGGSYIITITKEERERHNLKAGDFLDVEIKPIKKEDENSNSNS